MPKDTDHTILRKFLSEGNWRDADSETYRLILQSVLQEEETRWKLNKTDIEHIPCQKLILINKLWLEYSDGYFGFSVQKQIYQDMGGTIEYDSQKWIDFNHEVMWFIGRYGAVNVDISRYHYEQKINLAKGHLPLAGYQLWNAMYDVYLMDLLVRDTGEEGYEEEKEYEIRINFEDNFNSELLKEKAPLPLEKPLLLPPSSFEMMKKLLNCNI